ncbi:type I pullulanase [Mucisphaera sp.]|uniref:type I pullulanase n=1 Tax=Mucisphaera sp. TaxID=2913024 RepID=UPI003D0A431D
MIHGHNILKTLLALCLLLVTTSIAPAATPVSIADQFDRATSQANHLLVVHYHRHDEDYTGWNLWAWAEDQPGEALNFTGETSFGPYLTIPVDDPDTRIGFILRKNNWEARDVGRDRFVTLSPNQYVTEIWLVSGDTMIYTSPTRVDLSTKLVAAFLDDEDRIRIAATGQLTPRQRTAIRITNDNDPDQANDTPTVYSVSRVARAQSDTTARIVYDLHLTRRIQPEDVGRLQLTIPGFDPRPIYARDVLDAPAYTPLDAELGHRHTPDQTTFRVWSPVSTSAELLIYNKLFDAEPAQALPMQHTEKGIWEITVPGDHHGTAYQYRFRSYGQTRTAADINTYAATYDSDRSVVIDLTKTNPEGWGTVPTPPRPNQTDEIIYEIHVRDYTIADPTVPENLRGTYLGLIHENPATPTTPSTGINHLLDLGVTAIHLLPIHDFSAAIGEYNWGYWTALFNLPEANYATDPKDPFAAPTELKQAIQELHRNGIRVILDVVYNHTSSSFEFSHFHQTVPNYYFRTTDDGLLMNDAGVGNSIADERLMVRKYIVDSLIFWTNEYRIDGYRFDLLGTHYPATVEAICEALLQIRPDITLYGEPWTGGGVTHFPKGAQRGLAMAVFNDHFRNAIRGDLDGTTKGFGNGPGGNIAAIRNGIAGAIDDFADEPTETINYVSAHDNLTLWDKLVHTLPEATDAEKRAMQKLALGMVLTSQGVTFLHGGSDFARTKNGNHNSYNAGDEVNKFDWPRKIEYQDVYDYTRNLIAIRKAHPALRIPDAQTIREHVRFLQLENLVAVEIDGDALNDPWSRILIAYNGEPDPHTLPLPEGTWSVAVNEQQASPNQPLAAATNERTLPAYSMVLLYQH